MISLERCREILGKPNLSDEQVLKIRDQLYAMARVVVLQARHDAAAQLVPKG